MVSCGEGSKRQDIVKLVEAWQGREVIFPAHSVFTVQGIDTTHVSMESDGYKVLVYVDSIGCTSCRLQFAEWSGFINEVDSLVEAKVHFLFYLSPKSLSDARYVTRRDDFQHPICIDFKNEINRLNNFPAAEMFHTFLLDNDNRVKVIGSPYAMRL